MKLPMRIEDIKIRPEREAEFKAASEAKRIEIDMSKFPAASAIPFGARAMEQALGPVMARITTAESLRRVRHAMSLPYQSLVELADKYVGQTAVLVGGGASIERTFPKIYAAAASGAKVCAVNRSHDWLISGDDKRPGFAPHFGFMLDPAPHCIMYQTPHAMCQYLYGTQLDPSVFQKMMEADADVYLFVGAVTENAQYEIDLLTAEFPKDTLFLMGGTTGGLRAINALAVMGFTTIELHGFDSCADTDGALYPYAKPNVDTHLREFTAVSKSDGSKFTFKSNYAMARQVKVFFQMLETLPNMGTSDKPVKVRLRVHGDGVVPWMVWKDGGKDKLFEHADSVAMNAKYGASRHWDYTRGCEIETKPGELN